MPSFAKQHKSRTKKEKQCFFLFLFRENDSLLWACCCCSKDERGRQRRKIQKRIQISGARHPSPFRLNSETWLFPHIQKTPNLITILKNQKIEKLFGVQRKVFGVCQKTFPYPVSTVIFSADFLLFAREKNLRKVTFSQKKNQRRLPRARTLK